MHWFIVTVLLMGAAQGEDYIKRFIGAEELQIGFGENCYLHWLSDSSDTKNAEFRCGTTKGDPIQIVEVGNGEYNIRSGDKGLYWRGDEGDVKNAEFRTDRAGDKFYIRPEENGLFSIGFNNCPLIWLGNEGSVKNAEFRCGFIPPDLFWIRGENCQAINVEILPSNNTAINDGEEIVGIATGGTCDQSSSHTLDLSQTKQVTEEVGVEMARTDEINWSVSHSISVSIGASIFGASWEVTATTQVSAGGSVSYSTSKSRSTSTSTSSSAGQRVHYNTPGAAMIVGFVKRYKFDKSNVPSRVTVKCEGGHTYKYDSSIKLRSKRFGHTFFKTYVARLKKEKCDDNLLHCLYASQYLTFRQVFLAGDKFNQCFPTDVRVSR